MRIQSVTRSSRSSSLPNAFETEFSEFDQNRILEPSIEEETSTMEVEETEDHPARTRSGGTDIRIVVNAPDEEDRKIVECSSSYGANCTNIQPDDTVLIPDVVRSIISVPDEEVPRRPSLTLSEMIPVVRRGRQFGESRAARKVTRLVEKNGHSNVTITKVSRRNRRFIRDFFTTIMDMKLRYHIILFISGFLVSWMLFAVGWWTIAYYNGDMPRHNKDNSTDVCVINVYDFSTALLFSIEMQTTIGFGYRLIGEHCPVATAMMMGQSIVGIFIQCFITGIIFAKIARPLRRAKTIVFSRNAVICIRDGHYNLIFRVGDLRKTHIIGTSIRALLIRSRETSEGELIPLCQYPLDLITESSITDSFVFFFWPVTVAHRITESSPLWRLSAESILADQFEVIIILEGTAQTSGALLQVKTSYIPTEIKWGQRLTPLVTSQRDDGEYEIDYSNFHDTAPVVMADCSAEEYANKLTSHHIEPIISDYLASFTSSTPFVEVEERNSFRLAVKHNRPHHYHHLLPRPHGKTATNSTKDVKHKGRMTANAKMNEQDVQLGEGDSQLLEAVVVPQEVPPPTYESLGSSDDQDPGLEQVSLTIRINEERKEGVSVMAGNPIWFCTGGQFNRGYNWSQA